MCKNSNPLLREFINDFYSAMPPEQIKNLLFDMITSTLTHPELTTTPTANADYLLLFSKLVALVGLLE